jgi:hypothetical protein
VLVRWALGAIFLLAGALKIAQPGDFHSALLAYGVGAPDFAVRLTAVVFPWLEAFCGAALLADYWAETVRFAVALTCLIFVLLLGQAVLRGLDLKCGCFGAATTGWFDQPSTALIRAGVMLLGSVWVWLESTNPRKELEKSLRLNTFAPSLTPFLRRTPSPAPAPDLTSVRKP